MTELEEYFLYKCQKGLAERGLADKPQYVERLKFETDCIIKMGFPGYFLIVQDILAFARSQNILCGPGRGSVAGALTAYVLKITNLDPIRWGLMFERFLNPDRISMPDVDMDFPEDKRHIVIDYVREKYGADKVANIGTFGQMKAKGAVKASARTLGLPDVGTKIAKKLLEPIHGKPQPIATSLEKVKDLQKLNEEEKQVVHWAQKIENIFSSIGVHPSGVVISNESLLDTVPLFLGKSGEQTTQWDMNRIEDYGLVKFDFLGLKTLTKVQICMDLIKKRHGVDIDIYNLDLDDEATYAMLRGGHTPGIFQMETSTGMKDLLVRIRPNSLEDITALVAIFRPGPLDSDYKDIYLAVRAGEREPEYLVPELEPILKPTAGWMIYQEQVLQIASGLCGMSKAEADMLRRAIGKKKEKEIILYKGKFLEGWEKRGLDKGQGEVLWDQIFAFADYAFNKSHAAAYAMIAYWTGWLKTHYPTEFMCANLICDTDSKDQVIKYIGECRRLGIEILPPHVNLASELFAIESDSAIRFGLGPIKNLGEGPVKLIADERRNNGAFKDFKDFCSRVDLSVINTLKLKSLIKAGALDGLGPNRASLLQAVDSYSEYKKNKKSYDSKIATYNKKLAECEARNQEIATLASQGKKVPKAKKIPTAPDLVSEPQVIEIPELDLTEKMQAEHELLGFFVSNHPLDRFQESIEAQGLATIDLAKNMDNEEEIEIGAVISSLKLITTKKKANMAFLNLEDKTGSIEAVVFPREYERYKDVLAIAAPLKFFGTLEVIDSEEDEKVYKLIIKTISTLRETVRRVPPKKEPPKPLQLEITSEQLKDVADLIDSYRGDEKEVLLSVQMQDGSLAKFKGISVGDTKAFQGEFDQLTRVD
jgi:DNA polymerase III subunit alpha